MSQFVQEMKKELKSKDEKLEYKEIETKELREIN